MNDEQIEIIKELRESLDYLAGPDTLDMYESGDSEWEACGERATEMVWQQSPDETKQLLFGVMEAVENLTFLLDKLEGADSFGEDWTARLDELVLVEGPVLPENC